ncbi:3-oxo-5-alpha-steroid 4-dehydrogenase 2-like isoform X2 [Girardinichthys multiradiatus]|uniref:3-oxo-5-alpha-steroid 4-dehydrogenase 2-like isoform X2 n=1 Tax=Girardinichthys multiradiatus TaxID=208333 RepID=UPI001FACA1AD|nr:3-oxo-5-alpha-steroid 4-dehydrogenase 2-like isoform X2 [Girardinichthys multiradiatus]
MECRHAAVSSLSWVLVVGAAAYLLRQTRSCGEYGRYTKADSRCWPATLGWFLQEVPAFLVPLLLLLSTEEPEAGTGRRVLIWTFMLHYFYRSFVYSLLTRGRPVPLKIIFSSIVFCSLNGFLQGHYLLHCAQFQHTWLRNTRLFAGVLVFSIGLTINIHSDHVLRNLRKPGEYVYKIPRGGMFEFVSGANFFGEITEWCGYALAAWSLPAFAFAFFTICSIGPRAYYHHRYV